MFGGVWHFWRGACSVLEFWRRCLQCFGVGVAFLERCLQCFGGVWHFEAVLAVFQRGVAFLRRCLQCFGGAL